MILFSMFFWQPNNIPILKDIIKAVLGVVGASVNPIGTNPINISGNLPPLPFTNASGYLFNFFIGLAILTMIPKMADMIKDMLKAPGVGKYGTAFGEALGPLGLAINPAGAAMTSYGKQLGATPNFWAKLAGGALEAAGSKTHI